MSVSANISPDEETLVGRLRLRDREAFSVLYDRYSGALYGIIFRIVRNDEQAEDLVQEAFVKIWRSIESYDADKSRLFTWMMNIARNLAIDTLRSKDFKNTQKNQQLEGIVDTIDIANNVEFNPEQIGLQDLVAKLEPEQKKLVDLVYFGGYTHTEAAEELSLPLGTVKTRLRSAIMTLREYFQQK